MQNIKFKDFIKLQRGFDLPKKDRKDGQFPVVASTSITGYHDDYKVNPPGVTTGRSGSLGEVLYLEEKFWPLNTTLWVKDFKGNYPLYVYYFLKTLNLQEYNSGAGVPTLNRNHLDNIEINIHDELDQQKIATTLSAFDNLIENNTRRIAILEEVARRIYREWFVHFRYPGHEEDERVDSGTELGEIPVGWEVRKLDEVADANPENISTDYEGEIEYINISGVDTGKISETELYDFEEAPGRAKRKVKHGDIIWSSVRPNLKAYALILNPKSNWIASTGFAVIRPSNLPSSYIYNFTTTDFFVEYLVNHARGSAYPAVNVSDFKEAQVLVPEAELVKRFDEIVWPNYQQIDKLERKNKKLKQTRDLLLPKLISGKVKT